MPAKSALARPRASFTVNREADPIVKLRMRPFTRPSAMKLFAPFGVTRRPKPSCRSSRRNRVLFARRDSLYDLFRDPLPTAQVAHSERRVGTM